MQARICPRCSSADVHRSRRRNAIERLVLPFVMMRPYRCSNCNHRYLDFTFTHKVATEPEAESSSPEGASKRRRRKREPRPVGD